MLVFTRGCVILGGGVCMYVCVFIVGSPFAMASGMPAGGPAAMMGSGMGPAGLSMNMFPGSFNTAQLLQQSKSLTSPLSYTLSRCRFSLEHEFQFVSFRTSKI